MCKCAKIPSQLDIQIRCELDVGLGVGLVAISELRYYVSTKRMQGGPNSDKCLRLQRVAK